MVHVPCRCNAVKVRDWDELFNKADGLGLHCAHRYTVLHAECGRCLLHICLRNMHNDAFSPTLYPIQRVITSRFLKRSFFTVRPYKKAGCFVQRFLGIRRMFYPTMTRQWHWMPIEGTGCPLECSCYISFFVRHWMPIGTGCPLKALDAHCLGLHLTN